MGSDTRGPAIQDVQAGFKLRYDKFVAYFAQIGFETTEAIAREIGMTSRTIRRARNDDIIGEVFVASTLAALRRHGLSVQVEDVFELGEKAAA